MNLNVNNPAFLNYSLWSSDLQMNAGMSNNATGDVYWLFSRLFFHRHLQKFKDLLPEPSGLFVAEADSSVRAGITDTSINWSLTVFTLNTHAHTQTLKTV